MKIKYNHHYTIVEKKIIQAYKLTAQQKITYIVLCSYAEDNDTCSLSFETIAKAVGCSQRKVIEIIRELVELKLIVEHKKIGSNDGSFENEYEIVSCFEHPIKQHSDEFQKGKTENIMVLNFGRICIDVKNSIVTFEGQAVELKAMEYKLLLYLAQHKNRTISKNEIFLKVWGESITSDNTLNVHIRHLRQKLEDDPKNPKFIKTVWGTGYVFSKFPC